MTTMPETYPSQRLQESFDVWDLTCPSARLWVARLLVCFCFVWPFFNYMLLDPENTATEVNFLPVFLAALLVPEVTLREKRSILLALPVFAVALIWANPSAPLRLAFCIIPLHFLLNLTRRLRERGKSLLPPGLAYRTLQIFIGFSMVQAIDFWIVPIIPGWLTTALMTVVPRYSGVPYDDSGMRGVQGWASEPSGAAMACVAFALVAIYERPDRRWRVLVLFALFTILNRSLYALLFLALLSLACLAMLKRMRHALPAAVPLGLFVLVFAARSSRLADLRESLLVYGLSRESNHELLRLGQIFYPFQQFPLIYKPPTLFGTVLMEPVGVLPLVLGYGSVFGLAWLAYILMRNFPPRRLPLRPLAAIAGLALLLIVPPDLTPAMVAFATFMVPADRRRLQNLKGEV
jgi:hypothetical protein